MTNEEITAKTKGTLFEYSEVLQFMDAAHKDEAVAALEYARKQPIVGDEYGWLDIDTGEEYTDSELHEQFKHAEK